MGLGKTVQVCIRNLGHYQRDFVSFFFVSGYFSSGNVIRYIISNGKIKKNLIKEKKKLEHCSKQICGKI